MKKVIATGLLLLLMPWAAVGAAAVDFPQEVVQDTSAQMMDALRQNRATLDRDSGSDL
jgi:phospholipid transport system substrate-binding protein